MLAGDKRNGAICAAAVATLRNLDVSIVVRGGKMAALVAGRHFCLTQFLEQFFVVELAIELIHLRHLCLQFLLIALGEAAHHIELAQTSFFLRLNKLKNGVNAFLLGILDEAASVNHGYLALWAL